MALRRSGRSFDELRKVKITFNSFGYAPGSVLFEMGRTKVLCAVSIQHKVPPFLRGKKRGWLTAEYAMLPTATGLRTQRESTTMRKSGRSQEISRLIGRSLRTIIDFDLLGEKTIILDCDVLQADAGTRTACITGAFLALQMAERKWLSDDLIAKNILTGSVAAISVGWSGNVPLLDLDFSEDNTVDADCNVVMTKTGKMVEFQVSAEKAALSWEQFEQIRSLSVKGIESLFRECDRLIMLYEAKIVSRSDQKKHKTSQVFSLGNRQTKTL